MKLHLIITEINENRRMKGMSDCNVTTTTGGGMWWCNGSREREKNHRKNEWIIMNIRIVDSKIWKLSYRLWLFLSIFYVARRKTAMQKLTTEKETNERTGKKNYNNNNKMNKFYEAWNFHRCSIDDFCIPERCEWAEKWSANTKNANENNEYDKIQRGNWNEGNHEWEKSCNLLVTWV